MRALTIADVAAELNRTPDWLHRNWRRLAATDKFPKPVVEGSQLSWCAVHLYAWLDRDLPKDLRPAAAAFRAAFAAAAQEALSGSDEDTARWQQHLANRFNKETRT